MKKPEIQYCRIKMKGDFDTYTISQDTENDQLFVIESEHGFSNLFEPHRSLIAAIQHVNLMIKNQYVDRCLEEPK